MTDLTNERLHKVVDQEFKKGYAEIRGSSVISAQ